MIKRRSIAGKHPQLRVRSRVIGSSGRWHTDGCLRSDIIEQHYKMGLSRSTKQKYLIVYDRLNDEPASGIKAEVYIERQDCDSHNLGGVAFHWILSSPAILEVGSRMASPLAFPSS